MLAFGLGFSRIGLTPHKHIVIIAKTTILCQGKDFCGENENGVSHHL